MLYEIQAVALPFEFRRDDPGGPERGHAEGYEGRRHVDVLESAAHRVLASDGGQSESELHLQCAEQGAQGLAPAVGVVGHALEVLLIGEAHAGPLTARGDHLGAGLDHGIRRPVVGAPLGDEGIVAERHHARGVGVAVDRKLLDRNLSLGALGGASVGHQHGRAAHGGVEHLHEPLLRSHVGLGEQAGELLGELAARRFAAEGVLVLDGRDAGLRDMLRSGAVDEFAADVGHELVAVVHAHPAAVGDVGDVGHLHVLDVAPALELLPVGGFHDHGHALLGLADRELGGVQPAVFHGHPVEVNVKPGCELPYGHAYAARAEVVGLLYEPGHLRTAEEPLQLALLGGVALLDLAAAGLDGTFGMLLGGTGGPSDAVAPGPAAEQQDHVAGSGALAPHVLGLDRTHDGAGLEPLGHVAGVVDLAHAGGGEAYLVAVAGVAGRGLAADDPLGQLSGKRRAHGSGDVARTGHAHRLVDV